MTDEIDSILEQLASRCLASGWMLSVAESCTGGLIAKYLTDRPGSSAWFERGFVTYSNAAKQELLDVRPESLKMHGAVSKAVVQEMALGALTHSHADFSVAVSGIAGPEGGSADKPVGTVWLAWAGPEHRVEAEDLRLTGDRKHIRELAAVAALKGLLARIQI